MGNKSKRLRHKRNRLTEADGIAAIVYLQKSMGFEPDETNAKASWHELTTVDRELVFDFYKGLKEAES